MLFEVLDLKNNCIMVTEFKECIPDSNTLHQISASGRYKFRLNGKILSINSLVSKISNNDIDSSLGISDMTSMDTANCEHSDDELNAAIDSFAYPITSRTIYCIETKSLFRSQTDAAKEYGLDPSSISYYMSNGLPYKGYTFKKVKG